jgi:PHP family Zn ribbon phosphoesterase
LKEFSADLHIHTVLSPCAEVEMIPPLIIQRARELGLSILGSTDHNSSKNAGALIKAGNEAGITVFPGMELQTKEEVHLLCLFETLKQALQWQEEVYAQLPPLLNNEDHLGAQYVVDETGDYCETESRLLIVSAELSLEDAIAGVHQLGGIAIPSHIDRPSFSLLANLGFIPPGLPADALEISRHFDAAKGFLQYPDLKNWTLVTNGDAHELNQMRNALRLKMESPTFKELQLALMKAEGRSLSIAQEKI